MAMNPQNQQFGPGGQVISKPKTQTPAPLGTTGPAMTTGPVQPGQTPTNPFQAPTTPGATTSPVGNPIGAFGPAMTTSPVSGPGVDSGSLIGTGGTPGATTNAIDYGQSGGDGQQGVSTTQPVGSPVTAPTTASQYGAAANGTNPAATTNGAAATTNGALPTASAYGIQNGSAAAQLGDGSWVDQALKGASSTDDANYWKQAIQADNGQHSYDYWVQRINQGNGSQFVQSGQVGLYGANGSGSGSGAGAYVPGQGVPGMGTIFGGGGSTGSTAGNSLLDFLTGIYSQNPIPDANDPIIKNQVNAFSANEQRQNQDYLAAQAERNNGSASGAESAISRGLAEKGNQATSGYEATLMNNELNARRQQIMQALSGASGLLTSSQQMQLQEELAQLGLGQNAYQFDINDLFRNSPLYGS